MKTKLLAISLVPALLMVQIAFGASVEKATMLKQHGLTKEAKLELIDVIFNKSDHSQKAEAYYLLGSIAFEENKAVIALDSWRELVDKYPNTAQAKSVKDRIKELPEIVGESAKESVENAIALSYLSNANFWSSGKDNKFQIDLSWISRVEPAVKWYDKVISEFPKSEASRIAYQDKLRTLLGWEGPGKLGDKHGIKLWFDKYMPQLLETFASFEKDHPTASTLQAFRYQIAQVYWEKQDWAKARKWLNLIIKASGNKDSFYKDLAERGLKYPN